MLIPNKLAQNKYLTNRFMACMLWPIFDPSFFSMKVHNRCRVAVEHIDCLQMSSERLHREWSKEHPDIKVKGSGSIKKKHTPPEQKPLNQVNICLY